MTTLPKPSVPSFASSLMAAAVVAGAFGALTVAPAANASCASFFGMSTSAECTSGPTGIAIAIGTGASAQANGLFAVAIAAGISTSATVDTGALFSSAAAIGDDTHADVRTGAFDVASRLGNAGGATAAGYFSLAAAWGENVSARAGKLSTGTPVGNIALNLANSTLTNNAVTADGAFSLAVNVFGDRTAQTVQHVAAYGVGEVAVNVAGTNNDVAAGGARTTAYAGLAFSAFGSNNVVRSGQGPVALAGSINQNSAVVSQSAPGVNINHSATASPAATVARRGTPAADTKPGTSASVGSARYRGHKR
ncbi:hypothetical protein [Mycobacterium sp. DL592]|uniref:hypothetical protein n=1 Tax=Mycobacterium sp. DL592 TaxID=2675524 RepID=UPI00141FF937|nr:hypothetical protein [Mycobacterium sp. DL592]